MAGTTRKVQRAWKKGAGVLSSIYDFGQAVYDNLNAIVVDLTTIAARTALSGSATYDPASLADGAGATTTITVTGAALGDFADASFSLDLQGILLTAYVSAADTVAVRFQNETTGTIDLASGTLRARVTPQANGTAPTITAFALSELDVA